MRKLFLLLLVLSMNTYGQHTFQNQGLSVGIFTLNPTEALELYRGNAQITNGFLFIGSKKYFSQNPLLKIYRLYINGGVYIKNTSHPAITLDLGSQPTGTFTPKANFALASAPHYYSTHSIAGDLVLRLGASNQNKMILTNEGGGDIIFATGARDNNRIRASIKPNGYFGIGTTIPDEMLTVKGTIHTEEVKVDLSVPSVPDYVFEENYKLMGLEDLEKYLDTNKHLPEIPSAEQMSENGMNLKQMNLLLLKKVEELTLYVIKLNKEIQKLKENESQK